jgi:hypothetical protein
MDFATCNTLELTEALQGWEAARSGQAYDRNQTSLWKRGFALRISQQSSLPEFKPVAANTAPSTETRSTGSSAPTTRPAKRGSETSPLKRLLQSRRVRTA